MDNCDDLAFLKNPPTVTVSFQHVGCATSMVWGCKGGHEHVCKAVTRETCLIYHMEKTSRGNSFVSRGTLGMFFAEWEKLSDDERRRQKIRIVVSFDMGWQQRGFCSISGHAQRNV